MFILSSIPTSIAQSTGAAPTFPITSISISNGITYITDTKTNVFYRTGNGPWQSSDGQGWGISAYSTNKLAIAGLDSALFIRTNNSPWQRIGGNLISKTSGTMQGELWFRTTDNRLWKFSESIFAPDIGNDYTVVDFSVRDKVYVIESDRICARPLDLQNLERDCIKPSFKPFLIAASDTIVFTITTDGVLFATSLPLSIT
ncbi:hypothetical protein HDU97_008798 [Phlyctochytrium planicorne]|nr:hypothetical protein HDU97_008798 [Phlyctochytrium planicorne]